MKMTFACPSCAAGGSVDAAAAGRRRVASTVGINSSSHPPASPKPGASPKVIASRIRWNVRSVGSRCERPKNPRTCGPGRSRIPLPRGRRNGVRPMPARCAPPEASVAIPRQTWLIRGGIGSVVILAAVALLVPNGLLIVGCVLLVLGMLMVLAGYAAGAYGAFHEDFLYGFLYMVIPFYAAYYTPIFAEGNPLTVPGARSPCSRYLAPARVIRFSATVVGSFCWMIGRSRRLCLVSKLRVPTGLARASHFDTTFEGRKSLKTTSHSECSHGGYRLPPILHGCRFRDLSPSI